MKRLNRNKKRSMLQRYKNYKIEVGIKRKQVKNRKNYKSMIESIILPMLLYHMKRNIIFVK